MEHEAEFTVNANAKVDVASNNTIASGNEISGIAVKGNTVNAKGSLFGDKEVAFKNDFRCAGKVLLNATDNDYEDKRQFLHSVINDRLSNLEDYGLHYITNEAIEALQNLSGFEMTIFGLIFFLHTTTTGTKENVRKYIKDIVSIYCKKRSLDLTHQRRMVILERLQQKKLLTIFNTQITEPNMPIIFTNLKSREMQIKKDLCAMKVKTL